MVTQQRLRPISDVAAELGLLLEEVELYGPYKAKVQPAALARLGLPRALWVLRSGINTTPFVEGKATLTMGLGQALARLGLRTAITIRQSSLGPVFGTKGAEAGGEQRRCCSFPISPCISLGDNHVVTAAHNLLAALLDNTLAHDLVPLDVRMVSWPRVLDLNDRALR